MGLFYKIRLTMAKNGKISLKECSTTDSFNAELVKSCVYGRGAEEFQYASEWLRSDAEFILKLVKKHPGVLQYCEDVLYDRYYDENKKLVQKEIDKLFFATKCCDENLNAFKYLDKETADEYLNAVKDSKTIEGVYQGKQESFELKYSEYAVDRLLNIRYDIVRMGELANYI